MTRQNQKKRHLLLILCRFLFFIRKLWSGRKSAYCAAFTDSLTFTMVHNSAIKVNPPVNKRRRTVAYGYKNTFCRSS